jgi:hypothetical protein
MTTCTMATLAGLLMGQATSQGPLKIGSDPQLFLDDYVIARTDGLTRTVHSPTRLPQPVLDSRDFGTWQPYLTVLYDDATKRYRAWYNRGLRVGYAESKDGIRWENPRELDLPCTYSCAVIDDGSREPDAKRRFKLMYWEQHGPRPRGIYAAFSPDGLRWTPHTENPVLEAYGEDEAHTQAHHVGDIVDAVYDPTRNRHLAALKLPALAQDRYAPGPKASFIYRRLVGMSESRDFVHWSKPRRIFVPDNKDEGLLEFYGMGGIHRRGSLWIGFVRVLRDDLPCDPGGPKDGIGYTVLATSRDGVTWHRFRDPFLDRNPARGSWDHAMTWVGAAVPVGDELFLYYGGYARGHKIEARRERQIGLARLKKDRYLSLSAGDQGGRLVTQPLVFTGKALSLNAEVLLGGEVRVELQDEQRRPLQGFSLSDCRPVRGDHVSVSVAWPETSDLAVVAGRPVRLHAELRSARLYAFQFVEE